jgi:hypothetical protein
MDLLTEEFDRMAEIEYEARVDLEFRVFEESQHCPVCRGFIPEECDGDHSHDDDSISF